MTINHVREVELLKILKVKGHLQNTVQNFDEFSDKKDLGLI